MVEADVTALVADARSWLSLALNLFECVLLAWLCRYAAWTHRVVANGLRENRRAVHAVADRLRSSTAVDRE